jgi:hypothetical protein
MNFIKNKAPRSELRGIEAEFAEANPPSHEASAGLSAEECGGAPRLRVGLHRVRCQHLDAVALAQPAASGFFK